MTSEGRRSVGSAGRKRSSARAESAVIAPDVANPILLDAGTSAIQEPHRVALLARRPGVPTAALMGATGESSRHGDSEWADIELKYAGYLSRERAAAGASPNWTDSCCPLASIITRLELCLSRLVRN